MAEALALDHVAIATHRLADAEPFLVGVLGGARYFGMTTGPFAFGQWEFAGGGRIEILEPAGTDGFLHRFLAQRGPGVHHVTFKVPSLRAACARAESHGYRIVGRDERNPHWKEAFLHPKEAQGIVVQFAESPGAPPRRGLWRAPAIPAPPPGPPPATIVGLRLVARDRARAELQWGRVLEGRAEARGDLLVYRWPGAPLRIAVEIDPAAEDGPRFVEVAAGHPVPPPGGPVPELGTEFRTVAA